MATLHGMHMEAESLLCSARCHRSRVSLLPVLLP